MVSFKEVSDIRIQKARMNHEIYKEMWQKCSDKILADAKRNKSDTRYVVSPFIPGKPLVNVERAARYICDKLKYRGFEVVQVPQAPFIILFINWGCFRNKLKEQLIKVRGGPPAMEKPKTEPLPPLMPPKQTDITDEILAILAK